MIILPFFERLFYLQIGPISSCPQSKDKQNNKQVTWKVKYCRSLNKELCHEIDTFECFTYRVTKGPNIRNRGEKSTGRVYLDNEDKMSA